LPLRTKARAKRWTGSRLDVLRYSFLLVGGLIFIRLFVVQIVAHGYYNDLALNNHKLYEDLIPDRGQILVQDPSTATGTVAIATNQNLAEVHAEPVHITDPQATAEALSPLLNISVEDLLKKLNKPGDPDEILKRRVPDEVVTAITDLKLHGIKFRQEPWRYYPEGEYTAHITGYFGYASDKLVGQYGLEGYFNDKLAGTPGYSQGEKDAFGRFLTIGNNSIQPAIDGDDIVLTIDKNVQFFACNALKAAVDKFSGKQGTVIIQNPTTGAIITMCNYPSYDPNNYNQVDSVNVFRNAAVSDQYEPGSVFKAITMAAGLDRGVVTPATTYTDTGKVMVGGYPITNYDGKAYGVQTMTQTLEKSLNLGAMYVAQQVGNDQFDQYVHNFGFGKATGIELANEVEGDISQADKKKDVYTYTSSFGHGVSVTPIQMITAYSALANGGHLMKPFIVQKDISSKGTIIDTQPTEVRRVITDTTSRTISAMLVSVIDNGYDHTASIKGYLLAGKSGTATVADNGYRDLSRHNDTFIGFGPVSNPKFVVLVEMDEPKGVPYAEYSVMPTWRDIMQYLLTYYQIPPDRN